MTLRYSNSAFVTILPPVPLVGVGWYARVLSERDYVTPIALINRFDSLGFTLETDAEGGGKITLDADDRVLTDPLPVGETTAILEQEALWQIFEDGVIRAEFFAEDVDAEILRDTDGPRSVTLGGRGPSVVLDWAVVAPEGMPTPTSTQRVFNAHPMQAWLQLLEEAQADGYIPWVQPLFTATEDSAGQPWSGASEITAQAGETLLDLLKRWAEATGFGWRMLPGFRLQVMQDFGAHREDEVVFTTFRAQREHKRNVSRRDLANVIYADAGDNGIAIVSSSLSEDKWHKRAKWVTAGDSDDATARSAVANATLALSKDQKSSRSLKVAHDLTGRRPFRDFWLSDWITAEIPDGAESGAMRVIGISVDIDDTGTPDVELTLMSRFEARALLIQRQLDKLGAGTVSSGSSSPIPVSKALSTVKLVDLADVDLLGAQPGDVLLWDGSKIVDATPNLELLADVDLSTPPVSGDALVYSGGVWHAGATGGGGGGSTVYGPQWPIDKTPASPTAYDDEFTGTSLDAKWTLTNGTGGSPTATVADGLLTFTASATAGFIVQAITQPVPASGDWAFTASLAGFDSAYASYLASFLGLAESASGTSTKTTLLLAANYSDPGRVEVIHTSNWQAFSSTPASTAYLHRGDGYLRVTKSGSTYTWAYSRTGTSWVSVYSATLAYTPGRVILGAKTENGSNATTGLWKWFRRTA